MIYLALSDLVRLLSFLLSVDSIISSLANHFKYKKGYLLNTGGNTWGLDFVPKVESRDTSPFIQYLAVAGYRGASEERIGLNEEQPTVTYKNCVQLWKLKLSVKQEPEEPLLDVCILHDFGAVYDLKWCPYGVYEEVMRERLSFACAHLQTIGARRHRKWITQTRYISHGLWRWYDQNLSCATP